MQIDRPIAIAIILFVVLLLAFFLLAPQYNNFQSLRFELAGKRAEYNAKYDYYAQVDKIYLDLQNHQDDLEKIDSALPQNTDLAGLVYFLQETAKETGLIVKNLALSKSSPSNSAPGKNRIIKETVFSIDLMGNYSSLENFIISLEQSARIFEVTNVSFTSPGSSLVSFNLQVKTYSY